MKNYTAQIIAFKDGSTVRTKNGMSSLLLAIRSTAAKREKVYRPDGTYTWKNPTYLLASMNNAGALISWIGGADKLVAATKKTVEGQTVYEGGFDLNDFYIAEGQEQVAAVVQEAITPFYEGQQPAQRYTDAARTQLENLLDEAGNPIYRQVLAVDESAVPSLTKRVKQAARVAATTEAN